MSVPGETMVAKLDHLNRIDDSIRRFCVFEPRGCAQMSTNLVFPATRPRRRCRVRRPSGRQGTRDVGLECHLCHDRPAGNGRHSDDGAGNGCSFRHGRWIGCCTRRVPRRQVRACHPRHAVGFRRGPGRQARHTGAGAGHGRYCVRRNLLRPDRSPTAWPFDRTGSGTRAGGRRIEDSSRRQCRSLVPPSGGPVPECLVLRHVRRHA